MGDSLGSGEGGFVQANRAGAFGIGTSFWDTREDAYEESMPSLVGNEVDVDYRGCHRYKHAAVNRIPGWSGENFACSGSKNRTEYDDVQHRNLLTLGQYRGKHFRLKPGIDFVDARMVRTERKDGSLHYWGSTLPGQAKALEQYADGRNVKAIVLSIGPNDMGFGQIVADCVSRYVFADGSCTDNQPQSIKDALSASKQQTVTDRIEESLTNIQTAMSRAGHPVGSYRIVQQLPPSPFPQWKHVDPDIQQMTVAPNRQTFGQCGLYNKDFDLFSKQPGMFESNRYTNAYAAMLQPMIDAVEQFAETSPNADLSVLDLSESANGHRLCEDGAYDRRATLAYTIALPKAQNFDIAFGSTGKFGQRGEWFRGISGYQALLGNDDASQENAHPNHWGWQAMAVCLQGVLESSSSPGQTRSYECTPDMSVEGKYPAPNDDIGEIRPEMHVTYDSSPPLVTGVLESDPSGGWFSGPVRINWSVTDDVDDALPAPPSVLANVEGRDVEYLSAEVCDSSGNCSVGRVRVSLDSTDPVVQGAPTAAPNASGWFNSFPSVAWTCSDAGSGVAHCPHDSVVNSEGSDVSVSATGRDVAGNETVGTVNGLHVDVTPPELVGVPDEEPNANGWYRGDVSVDWTCTDDGSGVPQAACPPPTVLSGEGLGVSASADVSDRAGNHTAANSPAVSIDRTAPVTTVNAPAGWSGGDVELSFSATDNLSGVESTFVSVDNSPPETAGTVTVSGQGRHVVAFHSQDRAGNRESTLTVEVLVDTSGPVMVHTLSPEPNAAGWHKSPVEVAWECSDADSGVATCPAAVSIDTDGAGQLVIGEATDVLGNATIDNVTINMDQQDPQIQAVLNAVANVDSWYNTPVTVSWDCSDGLSGVASCPEPVTIGEGLNDSIVGQAVDAAGNSAATQVGPFKVDLTGPQVNTDGVADGAVYTFGDVPVAACDASDSGSGLAGDCTGVLAGGAANDVGFYTYTASATDIAGNTTTTVATYQVVYDTTAGFSAPLGGDSGPEVHKAGRTVPVKFQLLDADGNSVVAATPPEWIEPVAVGVLSQDPNTEGSLATPTAGSSFEQTGNGYRYNWKTSKDQAGYWWQIRASLDDGTTLTATVGLR